jgi:hypothetical protein
MSPQPDPARRLPPTSTWNAERIIVHACEDDLAAFLSGADVTLAFIQPGRTVRWQDQTGEGLALSEIEQLRGDGLDQWVLDPTCSPSGRRVVTLKIGSRQELPGSAESDERRVSMSAEAYRMLCGLVQRDDTIDAQEVDGPAWTELRRTFPAAQFARTPQRRVEVNMIAAESPTAAASTARATIADWLEQHPDHDIVVLTPIRETDGRYSATVIVHPHD